MSRTKMVSCVRFRRLAFSRRSFLAGRARGHKRVISAEINKKTIMTTSSERSLTQKEKTGRDRKYRKHPDARSETMADARKLPCRDTRTTTTRYKHTTVARLSRRRTQTKVINATAMVPVRQCTAKRQNVAVWLRRTRPISFLGPSLILALSLQLRLFTLMIAWNNVEFLGHPDQIGQRFRLHLTHNVTALNFDRNFTSPQFSSNLFIKPACDH